MGAYDDVDTPLLKVTQHLLAFFSALETRQLRHGHWEASKTLRESFCVLRHQQRGGHQHRHLLAVLDSFKGSPHRNLSFAVTHIPTDQAIHRGTLFHISLNLINGNQLIRGFSVGKRLL